MRLYRSLAGQWRFQLDPEGALERDQLTLDREIPVPLPWQAAFPELQQYSGYAWYQREFELDDTWLSGELLLEFGAVDYWCQVFVNGQPVGEHEGGYMPFRFPIRQYVQAGSNTLTVRVYDSVQDSIVTRRWHDEPRETPPGPPFDARDIPHGKQEWYINAGGIWQDVTLTAVPARYIERVHITPDIHSGDARVVVMLGGAAIAGKVTVTIDGHTGSADVSSADKTVTVVVNVPQARLWTPEQPNLYTAVAQLETNGATDETSARFGFREISTRDGKLLLNGEPIYLLCALDQDFYEDTIYTVPSEDYLRDQFVKAKQLGLNSLRCHIKPPDPRYLDLADEMGLLIWSEIPSWRTFPVKTTMPPSALHLGDDIKTRVYRLLEEMIARDYNHPSLVIWTIVNEDWGTALLLSEADRAWLAGMYDACKRLDPTRLCVDNSPCPAPWGLSVHVKSDLDDFHLYTNIPDEARRFEGFVEQFGLRPLWSFSNTGDAKRTGKEPLILSEFGNWAMPSLKRFNGQEPDWFRLGGWWSAWDGEPGYPTGVYERFERLGLSAIWPDYEAFAEATQWHAYKSLRFEIEAMRRQPGIEGYVITELSDIYWESNGLLDFARGTKVFHDCMAHVNSPDMIAPRLNRYAYWDSETVPIELTLSHYSPGDASAVRVWATTESGSEIFSAQVGKLERGSVRPAGSLNWALAPVRSAQPATLRLNAAGTGFEAENDVQVLALPAAARAASYTSPVAVITRAGALAQEMQAVGYQTQNTLSGETSLLVTDWPSAEMLAWVRDGGDMLFLSSGGSPFFWVHPRGGAYGGNWITSWNWLRPGAYRRLSVPSPLDLAFMDVTPMNVILGLPVNDAACHQDFLAGQISGWLGHPALHTVQLRYGKGRVIMTTYRIQEALAWHPVAVAMLHDLIDHLTSEACQPELKANF